MEGARRTLTLMTNVINITIVKPKTAFSNQSSQFSKLRPESATLLNSSGCLDSCSQSSARDVCRDAAKAVTKVKVNEKTMSTIVQSRKNRRYDGLRCERGVND